MLTLLLAAAAIASADTTVYPVMNHERVAGSMIVARNGDTTTVRFVYTDRNRGSRTFVRYVSRNNRNVLTEMRPVLANESIGEPTFRLEIIGDSIRQWTPARAATEPLKPNVYYAIAA